MRLVSCKKVVKVLHDLIHAVRGYSHISGMSKITRYIQSPSHSCTHLSFLLSLCECVLDSAGIHTRSSRQHGHLRTWLPHDLAHQHHILRPVHTQRYERTFDNMVIVCQLSMVSLVAKNYTIKVLLCNHCWPGFSPHAMVCI